MECEFLTDLCDILTSGCEEITSAAPTFMILPVTIYVLDNQPLTTQM